MWETLKRESDYYPKILVKKRKEDVYEHVYLSTIVRIKKRGIWYTVHCVKTGVINHLGNTEYSMEHLFLDLIEQVHTIQHLYTADTSMVDSEGKFLIEKDKLQKSEKSRLIKIFYIENGKSKDNLYRYSYRYSE